MHRRKFLSLAVLGLVPGWVGAAEEELGLVVPFIPGGGGDILARTGAPALGEALGKTLVVLNKPGAGGNIGTRAVVQNRESIPVIGYATNGIYCVNPVLYRNMGFDPVKDLALIGGFSKIGLAMVLNPKAIEGVSDLKSLIEYARKNPGAVNFASSGVGTTSHVAGVLFAKQTGTDLVHIPHRGGAAAIVEVLAGRIPFMIDVIPNVIEHIKAGKLKALAVTTPERSPLLPEVPTMKEEDLEGVELMAWDSFVAPKNTPKEVLESYREALIKAHDDPEVRDKIKARGAEPFELYGEEFHNFVLQEIPKWVSLLGQSKKN